MERKYIDSHYSTEKVEDKKDGFAAIDLYEAIQTKKKHVGRIIYWDATGQLYVEPFKSEVPLTIMEEMIAEAKDIVKP